MSAEAVSRAPALRFVALLFAVSVDCRLIDDGGKGASIVSSNKEEEMPNPGQPLIRRGDQGTAVFRAQRALRRTPDLSVALDGDFGPDTEAAVERFQEGAGLDVDGIVGDDTWAALPNGGPMPLLKAGSKGDVVRDLQEVLISGSEDGDWPSPGEADGDFGAETKASVEGFQEWGAGRCRRHRRRQDVGGASARGEQHSGNRCRTRLGRRLKRPARGRSAACRPVCCSEADTDRSPADQHRAVQRSTRVRTAEEKNPWPSIPLPSSGPKPASTACSGWGMSPTTLPASFVIPAMLRSEPFGFRP